MDAPEVLSSLVWTLASRQGHISYHLQNTVRGGGSLSEATEDGKDCAL